VVIEGYIPPNDGWEWFNAPFLTLESYFPLSHYSPDYFALWIFVRAQLPSSAAYSQQMLRMKCIHQIQLL
jgi:hypothetical protein